MVRKFRIFAVYFIASFFLISLLSFFPNQKAYALSEFCPRYDKWVNYTPIKFSVVKNDNGSFTAKITSSKSVMDQWANSEPNRDFQLMAFIGNVVYKNQLSYNTDKIILYDNATDKFTTQTFRITGFDNGTALNPGETYDITFRIFTSPIPQTTAGEFTLNACAIDSGAINRSYTAPETDPTDDSNPDNSTQTCEDNCPSGVCDEDGKCLAAFACEELANGEFRCITALGEINTNPKDFVSKILKWILAFAGGLLLILIIINGYKMMTSQGDPEKLKDAREGIIAAIAGILLIIFSLSILQLITVDIIGIPGFS